MNSELPFFAEYARTGRATCKGCKSSIPMDNLRIAVMVQSAFHDAKVPNWFHKTCFFKNQRPCSVGDIYNFGNLRFADQKELTNLVENLQGVISSQLGKKRSKAANLALKDFGIEYAKSSRSTCRGCEQKINKDLIRLRKTVYDTEVGMKYGGQPLWYHLDCFTQLRSELGWFDSGDNVPGFKSLADDDQAEVKNALPAIKSEELPETKRAKTELSDTNEEMEKNQHLKDQSDAYFKFRDDVKNIMKKKDIDILLKSNNQEPVTGDTEKLLDQTADLLTFGAIESCSECNSSQFTLNKSGYICNGNLSEWTKCNKLLAEPRRLACKVPKELKAAYHFLNAVSKMPSTRIFFNISPSKPTFSRNLLKTKKNSDDLDRPKITRINPPLYNLKFSIIGLKDQQKNLRSRIEKLGGKFEVKISENTIAIISTELEIQKKSIRMKSAQELGIHIVPIEFLDFVETDKDGAINYIISTSICSWGTDPKSRIPKESKSLKSNSIYTKSMPISRTYKVKDGLAVDPDTGLEDIAHVYVDGKNKYNIVLGLTDIQRNKNSYYKLQLLKADKMEKYWIFRSWGRIGTNIGSSKLEEFDTCQSAKNKFKEVYTDKTGNEYEQRDNFVKITGRMYPIEIQYGDDQKLVNHDSHFINSKLEISVQNLIKLIFDVDSMKKTLVEFHIDMDKMPLGKLSAHQIQSAYRVVTEIFKILECGSNTARLIDATNRFYTLIPHNFGVQSPKLIETHQQIEDLRQMLDSLSEIEVAYSLIKSEDGSDSCHHLDKHYAQIKTQLVPLDKNSEEFSILSQYVKNTHASTHKSYDLEIIDVFKVSRQGEARRFKPFKKLHNRKLLWHGSRLTNFVGILSHGLKIAPPEAPPTGYMFGKGLYFADMVSKSANYCCTSQQNSTGLMLLSEVALGDMMECTSAKYINKLSNNKHSCFGRGRTMPDPTKSYIRSDGVEIPYGETITNENFKSSLLYNEYIVYDVAQVNIQYLFRMEFKYIY
ncbi:poly [ADP-ribose] polymerase isoform X1 [Drosophila teissieri]|uniref:poly [ADP-ribose] polymerase isoform X1 n=2 Tax=Drosophila teissieri TaxID=7243 RepID=UPI001CB9E6AB|nr:poly [ADP-ribose] polymerase isoform X1 [Drosophila teissieri]